MLFISSFCAQTLLCFFVLVPLVLPFFYLPLAITGITGITENFPIHFVCVPSTFDRGQILPPFAMKFPLFRHPRICCDT